MMHRPWKKLAVQPTSPVLLNALELRVHALENRLIKLEAVPEPLGSRNPPSPKPPPVPHLLPEPWEALVDWNRFGLSNHGD